MYQHHWKNRPKTSEIGINCFPVFKLTCLLLLAAAHFTGCLFADDPFFLIAEILCFSFYFMNLLDTCNRKTVTLTLLKDILILLCYYRFFHFYLTQFSTAVWTHPLHLKVESFWHLNDIFPFSQVMNNYEYNLI